MKNKTFTWLTIKYKEDTFDIQLSDETNAIREIRPVDSEINIAPMVDKKVIYAIQEMVDIEINHKQQEAQCVQEEAAGVLQELG